MSLIYIITVFIWAILLTSLAWSKYEKIIPIRVFNFLLIIAIIPVLNTIFIVSGIYNACTDKRSREELAADFKRNCEYLDILLESLINRIKNNG